MGWNRRTSTISFDYCSIRAAWSCWLMVSSTNIIKLLGCLLGGHVLYVFVCVISQSRRLQSSAA